MLFTQSIGTLKPHRNLSRDYGLYNYPSGITDSQANAQKPITHYCHSLL
jgi:hypothetical protein